MAKAPTKPDSRAKALAGMTKGELIRTVTTLDRRTTTLLNRIAKLEKIADDAQALLNALTPSERDAARDAVHERGDKLHTEQYGDGTRALAQQAVADQWGSSVKTEDDRLRVVSGTPTFFPWEKK